MKHEKINKKPQKILDSCTTANSKSIIKRIFYTHLNSQSRAAKIKNGEGTLSP